MAKLDQEERDLLESVESGEWEAVSGKDAELARYKDYARATFRKDQRINIRISEKIWTPSKSGPWPRGFRTRP